MAKEQTGDWLREAFSGLRKNIWRVKYVRKLQNQDRPGIGDNGAFY